VYSDAHVLDILEEKYRQTDEDEWETSNFFCRRIGPDVYLPTYTFRQAKRVTRPAGGGGRGPFPRLT
jgi:hypothetical protein